MGSDHMPETIRFAKHGVTLTLCEAVARLSIDNPTRKNALTLAMWQAIPDAVAAAEAVDAARVILLSGAGQTDFSAGADISEFATVRKNAVTARHYEEANSAAFRAIRAARMPVLASIRGVCFGGGFGLAAAADLRLADETARFCLPPAKLGLAYPVDAIADIVAGLGSQRARRALYTGEDYGAAEMKAAGFLETVTTPERLETEALALAEAIAANAPLSIRSAKLAIRALVEDRPELAVSAGEIGASTFDSADYAEGRQAFAERRKPVFTGR